jgi:hypothetical protein
VIDNLEFVLSQEGVETRFPIPWGPIISVGLPLAMDAAKWAYRKVRG